MALATTAVPAQDSQEQLLLEYVRQLAERRAGRRAVHVRLSALQPYNRRQQHIRAAVSGFESLVDARLGQLFILPTADVVFVYGSDLGRRVDAEVRKIRFLFSDDPLLLDGGGEDAFVCEFDVGADFDGFVQHVRRLVSAWEGVQEERDDGGGEGARDRLRRRQHRSESLSPEMLERIEATLSRADLTNLVRRQTVCAVTERQTIAPRFAELFVSINDLRETVLPGTDLAANPWLFRRLTETLDQRMLAYLSQPENARQTTDVSINVNVATLMSREFLAFDHDLTAIRTRSLIIEVQLADVFTDIDGFLFARDVIQGKGYRVCLDGVAVRDVPMIDWGALRVDFVKLIWDPALAEAAGPREALARRLAAGDCERVVVSRVESEEAIRTGQELGARLFQGRLIDQIMREDQRRQHLLRLKQIGGHDT